MKKLSKQTRFKEDSFVNFFHLNLNKYNLLLKIVFSGVFLWVATPFVMGQAPADTSYWKVEGKSSLNFSQVSLSNWSEGGDGSVAGAFLFGVTANRKKDRQTWDNAFSLEYGMTKNSSESLRKSVDQIYLSSKYGYQLHKHWFFAALFDFKSQMAKGYKYPNTDTYISKLFAPAYMNFAPGFDFKPNDQFSLMLSPLSSKFTFVLDDVLSAAGAFGVDPDKQFRAEMGGYLKMGYVKKELLTNVDFQTRLDLFSNYLKNPQNIDVNWDVRFDMKINKFLSANFGTTLKYDNDIKYIDGEAVQHGPRVQLKQFLGVGLNVTF